MVRRLLRCGPRTALVPLVLVMMGGLHATAPSSTVVQTFVQPGDTVSVLDGVFSEAQANRGKDVFEESCLECHALLEFTGGPYTPLAKWPNVGEMFVSVSSRMPYNDPGSLSRQEYAAVLSYILQQNGYPSDGDELPGDVRRLLPIRIVPAAAVSDSMIGTGTPVR